MKCPACSSSIAPRLAMGKQGPSTIRCEHCGGTWLRAVDYWRWAAEQPREASPDLPSSTVAEDHQGLRYCPDDGYVMARFRVTRHPGFYLDQCRTCSGVWLDQGEWEELAELGLQARLGEVLSEEWELALRKKEKEAHEAEMWERRLGGEDLERIREIKSWLADHPKRSELLAFLGVHRRVDS